MNPLIASILPTLPCFRKGQNTRIEIGGMMAGEKYKNLSRIFFHFIHSIKIFFSEIYLFDCSQSVSQSVIVLCFMLRENIYKNAVGYYHQHLKIIIFGKRDDKKAKCLMMDLITHNDDGYFPLFSFAYGIPLSRNRLLQELP